MALSGAAIMLPGCTSAPASPGSLSDDQLRAMLQLNGLDLAPGEGSKIMTSFTSSRFTTAVDPMTQPQSDFDPDVDL